MFTAVYSFLNLFVTHLVVTAIGLNFVEAETLRVSNDAILNDLDEGVVIFDQDTSKT